MFGHGATPRGVMSASGESPRPAKPTRVGNRHAALSDRFGTAEMWRVDDEERAV
jgi:hypothetical protein